MEPRSNEVPKGLVKFVCYVENLDITNNYLQKDKQIVRYIKVKLIRVNFFFFWGGGGGAGTDTTNLEKE